MLKLAVAFFFLCLSFQAQGAIQFFFTREQWNFAVEAAGFALHTDAFDIPRASQQTLVFEFPISTTNSEPPTLPNNAADNSVTNGQYINTVGNGTTASLTVVFSFAYPVFAVAADAFGADENGASFSIFGQTLPAYTLMGGAADGFIGFISTDPIYSFNVVSLSGADDSFAVDNVAFGYVPPPTTAPPVKCSAQTYGNANWLETNGGQIATGTCVNKFSGSPQRLCLPNGQWSTNVFSAICAPIKCNGLTEDNAVWPTIGAGVSTYGTCVTGYGGQPIRTCDDNGVFGPISNPCVQIQDCVAETFGRATWPTTQGSQIATGTCLPGFTGSPTRLCFANGTWRNQIFSGLCQQNRCSAENDVGGANWPATNAGSTIGVRCNAPSTRTNVRTCGPDTVWQPPQRTC